jgi:hypothetical protein
MNKRLPLLLVALFFVLGCTTTKKVDYYKELPSELDIHGIQRVAVADFDGLYRSGRIIASKVAAGLVDTGHYRLFEREKMAEILSEHDLYKRGAGIDAATTRQLRLHGVDALIFGVVDAYSITDQRGTSAVEKKLGTGRFRKVAYKDPKTGETKYKDEEIMRTVLWNRPYILRQGSVGVTFRMANIVTGEIVAVEAMTSNFSEKAWKDEIDRKLPAKDAILDSLATEVVRKFLNKIQPHTVKASIALEATGGQHNKLGILYARNGLWDKALDEFEIARQGEHANPSAHYNSGMVYYVLGDYANAVSLVEQAIAIEPKRKYVRALAMIRSLSYE